MSCFTIEAELRGCMKGQHQINKELHRESCGELPAGCLLKGQRMVVIRVLIQVLILAVSVSHSGC